MLKEFSSQLVGGSAGQSWDHLNVTKESNHNELKHIKYVKIYTFIITLKNRNHSNIIGRIWRMLAKQLIILKTGKVKNANIYIVFPAHVLPKSKYTWCVWVFTYKRMTASKFKNDRIGILVFCKPSWNSESPSTYQGLCKPLGELYEEWIRPVMLQPTNQSQCHWKEKQPENTCLMKMQWKAHHIICKLFLTTHPTWI